MLEAIAIFLVGFIPGLFSYVVVRKVRARMRERLRAAMQVSTGRFYWQRPYPYMQAMDYQYIEGVGYIVGDITCQYNARSAYIRCAVNPSGPCKECPHYESIEIR
ncbi:MAG: hypothetical protein HC866_02485 [Leptolyngbyaceae cyanobacterium RU_5_1]|nr:hypothetical protein [Leptolyngbyaceae cyanobacterium RU_5_1]